MSHRFVRCPNPRCRTNYTGLNISHHFAKSPKCALFSVGHDVHGRNVRPRLYFPDNGSSIQIASKEPPATANNTKPSPIPQQLLESNLSPFVADGNRNGSNVRDAQYDLEFDLAFDNLLDPDISLLEDLTNIPSPNVNYAAKVGGATYEMVKSFHISQDKTYARLDPYTYPKHLPGMAQIIHKLRSSGCPLSLVDDLLSIIEEEVRRERFDPKRLPRSKSSMCRIMDLFKVPAPCMVSVPMERTPWQKRHKVQPK